MKPKWSQCDIGVVAVSDVGLLPGPKFKMRTSHTFMYPDFKNIHIGQLIDARIKKRGMTYAEFARHLCIERTTVYNIIRSKSIDTERLIRIGQILDYDFLRNVYLSVGDEPATSDKTLKIEIDGREISTGREITRPIRIMILTDSAAPDPAP